MLSEKMKQHVDANYSFEGLGAPTKSLAGSGIHGKVVMALVAAGYSTLRQVREATDEQLKKIHWVGPHAIQDIRLYFSIWDKKYNESNDTGLKSKENQKEQPSVKTEQDPVKDRAVVRDTLIFDLVPEHSRTLPYRTVGDYYATIGEMPVGWLMLEDFKDMVKGDQWLQRGIAHEALHTAILEKLEVELLPFQEQYLEWFPAMPMVDRIGKGAIYATRLLDLTRHQYFGISPMSTVKDYVRQCQDSDFLKAEIARNNAGHGYLHHVMTALLHQGVIFNPSIFAPISPEESYLLQQQAGYAHYQYPVFNMFANPPIPPFGQSNAPGIGSKRYQPEPQPRAAQGQDFFGQGQPPFAPFAISLVRYDFEQKTEIHVRINPMVSGVAGHFLSSLVNELKTSWARAGFYPDPVFIGVIANKINAGRNSGVFLGEHTYVIEPSIAQLVRIVSNQSTL